MCCFSAEILLTLMEFFTWASVISWCKEHVGPLKNLYQHITDWLTLEPARPCPHPVSPAQVCRLSQLGLFSSPGGAPRPEQTLECEEGWGGILDLCTTCLTLLEERALWWASLSACPAAFTVVWLTVGLLVGDTDPRGQQWVGSLVLMNVFLSLDSGHLQSHLKKMTYTDFFFFLYVCFLSYFSHTFVTFPHSSKMAAKTSSYVQIYGWSSNT